ncbi:MAG TPA: hypothetical protein PK395_04880 [bacterium]|nr:hypothetical protein [bacterium]HQP98735.1 hypothetical protein [bacterium]
MEWVICGGLTVLDAVLLWWIFVLRREIRQIREMAESRRPGNALSEEDLRALQKSLTTLVETLESYTEEHLAEMRNQVESMRELATEILRMRESAPASNESRSSRSVRIRPDASLIEHREKERIIALHRQGKSVQEISRTLQVTAGEVELVIRLSS